MKASEFWARTEQSGDCLLWRPGNETDIYSSIRVDGRRGSPYQHAWLLTKGTWPAGRRLVRTCGNTWCVRPEHLSDDDRSVEDRFWPNVQKSDGCWKWIGAVNASGYGRLSVSRVTRLAHRVSWTLHLGEIPAGKLVCHHCDNPPCVRPEHLFLGDQLANMQDMAQKGRAAIVRNVGTASGSAKLTDSAVLEIRARFAAGGVSKAELARAFGVGEATIFRVVKNTIWTHLLPEGAANAR